MAPGDTFEFRSEELTFSYLVEGDSVEEVPVEETQLKVDIGDQIELLDIAHSTQTNINSINIRITQGPPGMLVRTVNQEKLLTVPGHRVQVPKLGLSFLVRGMKNRFCCRRQLQRYESCVLANATVTILRK